MKKKDYGGFKVVLEDNLIKVISEMKDWKEENNSDIDKVTYHLENDGNLDRVNDVEGCLVAYEPQEGTDAEEIISALPQSSEQKESQVSSDKSEVDDRENVELGDVQEMSIRELFGIKLNLPSYQRPYRWGRKNIEFFWNDIKNSKEKYDFGIAVFHRRGNGVYDIVDGQQRIVTLSLILRSFSSQNAKSFIDHTTLQGKDSEKNIGYNLQWFRRQKEKLNDEEKEKMRNKILEGFLYIIVMDDLDDALKFFDRTNKTGVPLSETDILKSYHLQVLSTEDKLSPEVKERWQKISGFPAASLDNIKEFKKEVVIRWESLDSWCLKKRLSEVCALREMANGGYALSMDDISDIEQFRKGDNNKECVYTGLESPMADGEFFFWYVFNLYEKFENIATKKEDRKHVDFLRSLLCNINGKAVWRAQEMFDLLVVYLDEKFRRYDSPSVDENQYNKVLDFLFSWLSYLCLYWDSLQFATIRKSALEEESIFKAVIASKSIEDCFDCSLENPLERLTEEGWGGRIEGNGVKYLIRRELRRIYGEEM